MPTTNSVSREARILASQLTAGLFLLSSFFYWTKPLAVLSKSATLLPQTGNPQPRTWHSPDGTASFNSEGLPNQGIDYYLIESTISECMDGIDNNKPYIVSLSGKTLEDNLEMLRRIGIAATRPRIASIELNLACPNVIGKPIIAYDFAQMDEILSQVGKLLVQLQLPLLGVKLPPYLDFQHFEMTAAILNKHQAIVRYVATINTVGNALAIDAQSEAPYISSNSGFAGLSGPAIKYTALANVRKLRSLLNPSIAVVGVGGIRSGMDVLEMLLAGATACQIATCHWTEGPGCFDRICHELTDLLREKGYRSASEVCGQLRDWTKEGAAQSRSKAKTVSETSSRTTVSSAKKGMTVVGSGSSSSADANLYKALSAVLALVLAAVLAQRWTDSRILPSECLL